MKRVTVKIILDTRRKKANGLYPAKLRITFDGVQKYYPTGKEYNQQDFDRIFTPKPRDWFKGEFDYLDAIRSRAKTAADALPVFSFQLFESRFYTNGKAAQDTSDVYQAFERAAAKLTDAGRISTADGYRAALVSLKSFRARLQFIDVTPDFLEAYQKHTEQKGKSRATVGIYLRYLRTLFNDAIQAGVIGQEHYPFGKKKFVIPTDSNAPRPMSLDDIKKLLAYRPADDNEREARDFWIFSYVSNGMNVKDIAALKYKNLDFKNGKIRFVRSKTRRAQAIDMVVLHPFALSVIDRYGKADKRPESYVFPFFDEDMTPNEEHRRKHLLILRWNKFIRRICSKIGIENAEQITTYSARDSYASNMKELGASIELISESLGHSDVRTTRAYMAKFSDDARRKFTEQILPTTDDTPTPEPS